MSGYSQFIYGKFYNWNSGYRLVACTSDLKEYQEQLRLIAERDFRFWGSQPPEGNKKAVGIAQLKNQIHTFSPQDYLVLVQTEEANVASGGSPYTQQRYIFVPKKDIINESSLLRKLFNSSIPTLPDEFEANLECYKSDLLDTSEVKGLNYEKIQELITCLKDKKDGEQSLILSAFSALLNKQKLILTIHEKPIIIPQKFLDSILLFLPFNCRNLLAVAIGCLDEARCTWADLIINTNGNPNYEKLPNDMIWVNRASRQFLPQIEGNLLKHTYVKDFIAHIDHSSDSIQRMLQHLQTLTSDEFTVDNLSQPDILVHIIPGLSPENKQVEAWLKYIPKINNIQTVIDKNIAQESLLCLFKALEKLEKHQPIYNPSILLVIQKLEDNKKIEVLQHRLTENLELAEKIIFRLFDILHANSADILNALKRLCIKIIENKINSEEALNLAIKFTYNNNIFPSNTDKLIVLDAVLIGENIPSDFCRRFFDKFAHLLVLVDLQKIHDSNLYKKHLGKYFPKVKVWLKLLIEKPRENLIHLLDIADEMKMSHQNTDEMFLSFLKSCSEVTYEETLPLLRLLIDKIIYKQNTILNLNTDIFPKTFSRFKFLFKEFNEILNQLKGDTKYWNNWYQLAKMLYKSDQERITFLDKKVELFPEFSVEILTQWMSLIETQPNVKNVFLKTNSWLKLEKNTIDKFLSINHKYTLILSKYLTEQGCYTLISGKLLRYLCQKWLTDKTIDSSESDLWNLLVTTDNKLLESHDWLQLIHVSWYLEKETVISLNKIILNDEDKETTYGYVFDIIQNCKELKKGQKLIHDCYCLKLNRKYIQDFIINLILNVGLKSNEIVDLINYAENEWSLNKPEKELIFKYIIHNFPEQWMFKLLNG